MTTKITKRAKYEMLSEILGMVSEDSSFNGYDFDMLQAFITHEIEQLDKKSAKAKETAQAKKADNDELYEVVASLLGDEPMTREQVAAKIQGDDVTVAKVGYRLSRLVANGMATKEEITVPGEDGNKARRMVAYKLA